MAQMTITQFMTGIKNWVLGKIGNITALIPSQASSSNQLADKAFVNSSIATATATFRGTYNVVSDLSLSYNATHAQIQTALATKMSALSITPDNNDYVFVQIPTADATPTQIAKIERYKYSGSAWAFEYELNNSGFTAAQWAAINSGITGTKVTKLDALPTNAELTALLAGKQNVLTFDNAPTENSNNPVKSGGIYTAIVNTIAAIRSWALGLFARKDGSYDTLSAGSAKDLEGDVVDNNTFLFRKSGGLTSVAKGNALVNTIKGNTVAWNQLTEISRMAFNVNSPDTTYTKNGNVLTIVTPASYETRGVYSNSIKKYYLLNHKFYISLYGLTNGRKVNVGVEGIKTDLIVFQNQNTERKSAIFTGASNAKAFTFYTADTASESIQVVFSNLMFIDLTLIFGAGNEPTSVEAFESWLAQNIGLKDYYPYNAGELISCNMQGIKTVGFNQWDEEWEVGTYNINTGVKQANYERIRSKNPISVIAGQTYYAGAVKSIRIFFYDKNNQFVSYKDWTNSLFTIPDGIAYITFCGNDTYGTTYNHDICINISDTDKNGTYEPYWTETKDFDVKKVYGKLNGEGSLVQVFPNGMRSAGTVRDLLDGNQAVKNIGSVDLGTLTWAKGDTVQDKWRFRAFLNGVKKWASDLPNLLSCKYEAVLPIDTWNGDKVGISVNASAEQLLVYDPSYNDASAFTTAMNGIMLNYELAESLYYTDLVYRDNGVDVPLEGINYKVDTLGTEEIVVPEPPSGADADTVTSCAPTMAITYGMNAVKTIQNLNSNFVSPKQAQTFTDAEKTQARSNIGAADAATMAEQIAALQAIVADIETIAEGYVRVAGSSNPALNYKSYKYHEQGGFGRDSVFSLFYPCLIGTKLTGNDAQVGHILHVLNKLDWAHDIYGNERKIDGSEGDVLITNIEPYYYIRGRHTIDNTEYDVFLVSRTPFTWQGIEAERAEKFGWSPDYCVKHTDTDNVNRMHSVYNPNWNGSYTAPDSVVGKFIFSQDAETGEITEEYDSTATLLGGSGGLHSTDITLYNGEQYAMNNNPDTTKCVPFMNHTAEGVNKLQTLLLAEGGTFDSHNATLMGSGFCSNDGATAAADWEAAGSGAKNGVRVKDKNDTWMYFNLNANAKTWTGKSGDFYLGQMVNSWRNPFGIMEAQRAVCYAIQHDVHELEWFVFEGNKYKWRSVTGFASPAQGEMTCVLWKLMATKAASNVLDPTDKTTSIQGNRVEILISIALFHGMTTQVSPSWWTSGLVFTEDENKNYEAYFEREQESLIKTENGEIATSSNFNFETLYEHVVSYTTGEGYRKNYSNQALMLPNTNANKSGAGLHTYVGAYNWLNAGAAGSGKKLVRGFRRGDIANGVVLSPLTMYGRYAPSDASAVLAFGICVRIED